MKLSFAVNLGNDNFNQKNEKSVMYLVGDPYTQI